MQQFAHRAHPAIAEMVDVVDRPDPVFQVEIGGDGGDDVVHRDVLVAEFVRQRADLLALFPGGDGVFAAEHGVESLARLHEFAAVVPSLFAVLLLLLLFVRLFGALVRIIEGVDPVDVLFRDLFHRHALAVGGDQPGKLIVGIIDGGQQPEILGARL